MTHPGSRYRYDIRGLRVVGVGILFIISGFLISGIICRDIERGTFGLADFYR